MKKHFILSAIFLLLVMVTIAPCSWASTKEGFTPVTLSDLSSQGTFEATLSRKLRLTPEYTMAHKHYHVQQGSATDGTYGYFIMENQINFQGSVWKVNLATWEVEKTVYGIEFDHGNDMAYNPKTNQLIVVHNKPNYNTLSFLNPDSLEIVNTITLPFKMYGLCYHEKTDQYIAAISGSWDFYLLDKDFNIIQKFQGVDTGLVKQGIACDDNFIYFPQNSQDQTVNKIIVYDWQGNYINEISVKSMQEIESMFLVDNRVIIAFNASGSYIYEASFFKKDE